MEKIKSYFAKKKEERILRKKNKLRRGTDEQIMRWAFFAFFLIYAISLVAPFLTVFVNSFYELTDYNANPEIQTTIGWKYLNLESYIKAFDGFKVRISGDREAYLTAMLGNSLIYIVITVVPTLLSSMMAAYVVSKYNFKLKPVIYNLVIIIQVIPIIGAMASSYKLIVDDLQLFNKPWIYWITCCSGFDFAFVLFYGYFNSVSWEYAEAAQIDGAGNFRIFWHVMVPQAKPVIVALTITTTISSWNDYMTPMLYLPDYPTIAFGLYQYNVDMTQGGMGGDPPMLFAGIVMAALPALILFSVFQQTIMENTVAGGLKG